MALENIKRILSERNPTKGKKWHFIFVVPNEIRKEIVRPIFIKAGIINDIDHPSRLLFYTKLDALIFGLQDGTYELAIDDIHQLYDDVLLERGRRYTLYDFHPNNEKGDVLIRSHSFDTIQTKEKIDSKKDFFIMDLDYVCISEYYTLVFLDTIRENMIKLL
jgi:hypothetical protein